MYLLLKRVFYEELYRNFLIKGMVKKTQGVLLHFFQHQPIRCSLKRELYWVINQSLQIFFPIRILRLLGSCVEPDEI